MKNDELKGEDAGFAINGGRGWKVVELTLTLTLTPTPTATLALALALTPKAVEFSNHKIDLNGPTAQAMGEYPQFPILPPPPKHPTPTPHAPHSHAGPQPTPTPAPPRPRPTPFAPNRVRMNIPSSGPAVLRP